MKQPKSSQTILENNANRPHKLLKLGVGLLLLVIGVVGIKLLLPKKSTPDIVGTPALQGNSVSPKVGSSGQTGRNQRSTELPGKTHSEVPQAPVSPTSSSTHMTEDFYRTSDNSRAIREFSLRGLVSAAAASALLGEVGAEMMTESVVSELLSIASDPNLPLLLRRYSIASLGHDRRDSVVSVLVGLATQSAGDVMLKSGALWALGQRVAERHDVAAVFRYALASEEDQVQFASLFNLGRSSLEIPFAVLLGLTSEAASPFISAEAVSILGERFGKEAIPHLRQIAEETSGALPIVRQRSKHVLESLAKWDQYLRDTTEALVIKRIVTVNGVVTEEKLYPIAAPLPLKRK